MKSHTIAIVAVTTVLCACSHRAERIEQARSELADIKTAVECYEVDQDQLPTNLTSLLGDGHFGAPYIKHSTVDPWGTPLQYLVQSNWFEIRSAGPDRRFSTADDIEHDNGAPNNASERISVRADAN